MFKVICVLLALFSAHAACAAQLSPLYTRNYSPLVHFFGIPVLPDVDALVDRNHQVSLHLAYASHFAASVNERELAFIDGETHHYTLDFKTRISAQSYLKLELPYIHISGGTLDGFIEEWHDLYALPQSGRKSVAKDRLQFYYKRDGEIVFDENPEVTGLGDISVSWHHSIQATTQRSVRHRAATIQIKFPSGDAQRWLGSGAMDLAMGLAERRREVWMDSPGAIFLSSGVMIPGKGRIMPQRQRPIVLYGGAGAAIQLQPRLVFNAQLDLHSPLYNDTDIAPLGQEAAQLSLGGNILFASGRLEISVSEDLLIDASPDVTFNLGAVFSY